MDIEIADSMPDGCQLWLDWHRVIAPNNEAEIKALEADCGEYLGYVRLIGRRRANAILPDQSSPCLRDTSKSLCCVPSPDAAAKTVAERNIVVETGSSSRLVPTGLGSFPRSLSLESRDGDSAYYENPPGYLHVLRFYSL